MPATNNASPKVKFIRVHGRVIPVKVKQGLSNRQTGAVMLAGSVAVEHGLMKSYANHLVKTTDTKKVNMKQFRVKYKEAIREARNPKIAFSKTSKGAQAVMGFSKTVREGMFLHSGVNLKSNARSAVILGTQRGEATLLHELGHIASSKKRFTGNRYLRGANTFVAKATSSMTKNSSGKHFAKFMLGMVGRGVIAKTAVYKSEVEASGWALKHSLKKNGVRGSAKIAASLGKAGLAYGLKGAAFGLAAVGLYKLVKGGK